ncbi:MAG TPA: DivIVA domain-containing protein [Micromonosporaceae bacterium]
MGQLLLFLVIGVTAGAIVFGVAALVTGNAPGLAATEPDGRAVPLPTNRPLTESDLDHVRFDTSLRGYRMAQVDQALRRAAYDIGYKDELIGVLEAEIAALREGRTDDADALLRVREAALTPAPPPTKGTPAAGVATASGGSTHASPEMADIELDREPGGRNSEPADSAGAPVRSERP